MHLGRLERSEDLDLNVNAPGHWKEQGEGNVMTEIIYQVIG